MDQLELSLLKGNTPLIKAIRMNMMTLSMPNLYFKLEDNNPTGSLTDRCIHSVLKEKMSGGAEKSITQYGGENAISAAAYSSRLGISSYILVPKEHYKRDCVKDTLKFDSTIIVVDATREEVEKMIEEISSNYPCANLSVGSSESYNNGIRELQSELIDEIQNVDYLFIGVRKEANLKLFNLIKDIFTEKGTEVFGVTDKEELANNNSLIYVEDIEIEQAHHLLTKQEGLLRNEISSLSVAGYIQCENFGKLEMGKNIVCILDNRDYDLGIEDEDVDMSILKVDNNIEEVKQIMGLK